MNDGNNDKIDFFRGCYVGFVISIFVMLIIILIFLASENLPMVLL